MNTSPLPVGDAEQDEADGGQAGLFEALTKIAGEEARFIDRFYELFFLRRPDTTPLFGRYAIAEKEEMIRETLRSLVALSEQETWLEENLAALGRSHDEYGVTADMYESYCDTFVECSREILGERLEDAEAASLRAAIMNIAAQMIRAAASGASQGPAEVSL